MAQQQIPAKDELLMNMQNGWNEFFAYLKTLSDEQMTARTDAAGWTVKDHLTHLAVWADGVYGMLMGRPRREAMGIDEKSWSELWETRDFDPVNGMIQQRHKDKTLAEVFSMLHDAHQRLFGEVQAMSNENLQLPQKHFDSTSTSDTPIALSVVVNTYGHYAEHRPWIEAIAGG